MRRSVLSFSLSVIVLGGVSVHGIKSAIAASEMSVVVPANSMCTDSGIDVRAGEAINFQASGSASYGYEGSPVNDTPQTDADGNRYSHGERIPKKDDSNAIYFKAIGSLVGKVGTNGNYFYIGSTNRIKFSRSGRLFLCYNDVQGQFGNNTGAYRVSLNRIITNSAIARSSLVKATVFNSVIDKFRRTLPPGQTVRLPLAIPAIYNKAVASIDGDRYVRIGRQAQCSNSCEYLTVSTSEPTEANLEWFHTHRNNNAEAVDLGNGIVGFYDVNKDGSRSGAKNIMWQQDNRIIYLSMRLNSSREEVIETARTMTSSQSLISALLKPSDQINKTSDRKLEYQDFANDFCAKRPRDCINVSVAANLSLNIAYKDNQAAQETAFKQALKEYAEVLGESLIEDPKVSVLYPGLGRSDANVGGRVLIGVISTQKNNRSKDRYIIAFRGTDFTSSNPIESLLNASSDSNSVSQSSKTKFHPGFEEHTFGINPNIVQLQNVIAGVIELANKSGQQDDVEVMITGHSLGGASAEVYAAKLSDKLKNRGINTFSNIHVITFGAPPAIKGNLVSGYADIPAIRIEKSGDIVMDLTTNGSLNDAYRLLDNVNGAVQFAIGSQPKTIIQQFRDGHYRSFAKTHIISDKSPKMQAAQRELQVYDNLNPILKAGVNLNSGALLELEENRRTLFNEGISAHLSYGEYYDLVFKNPTLKSRLKFQLQQ